MTLHEVVVRIDWWEIVRLVVLAIIALNVFITAFLGVLMFRDSCVDSRDRNKVD